MPTDPPTGFLTRPEAARLYNRSQRALQRDLDTALRVGDSDALEHWKLMTKEGDLRDAGNVSIDLVKQLQSQGKVPVWYIDESYLQDRYGQKGMPKPQQTEDRSSSTKSSPIKPATPLHEENGAPELLTSSPSDVEFLKERIRTLEREKREEAARTEKREQMLYEQLAVKDKQISAWDDLTQGLMRGLATGQLKPDLAAVLLDAPNKAHTADDAQTHKQTIDAVKKPPVGTSKPTKRSVPTARTAKKSSRTRKKSTASKRQPKQETHPQAKDAKTAPRWFETPTLNRFLSRK